MGCGQNWGELGCCTERIDQEEHGDEEDIWKEGKGILGYQSTKELSSVTPFIPLPSECGESRLLSDRISIFSSSGLRSRGTEGRLTQRERSPKGEKMELREKRKGKIPNELGC